MKTDAPATRYRPTDQGHGWRLQLHGSCELPCGQRISTIFSENCKIASARPHTVTWEIMLLQERGSCITQAQSSATQHMHASAESSTTRTRISAYAGTSCARWLMRALPGQTDPCHMSALARGSVRMHLCWQLTTGSCRIAYALVRAPPEHLQPALYVQSLTTCINIEDTWKLSKSPGAELKSVTSDREHPSSRQSVWCEPARLSRAGQPTEWVAT